MPKKYIFWEKYRNTQTSKHHSLEKWAQPYKSQISSSKRHRHHTFDTALFIPCSQFNSADWEQSLLYKRNHTKGSSWNLPLQMNPACFAIRGEGRGFGVSAHLPLPDLQVCPASLISILSTAEPSQGPHPNTAKQVEVKGNKVITSIMCSYFWDTGSNFHFFPHAAALELFVIICIICIPGLQSKNVLCYTTTLEGTKPPRTPIKLHQIPTSRGILQNHGQYSGIPQTGIQKASGNICNCSSTVYFQSMSEHKRRIKFLTLPPPPPPSCRDDTANRIKWVTGLYDHYIKVVHMQNPQNMGKKLSKRLHHLSVEKKTTAGARSCKMPALRVTRWEMTGNSFSLF